MTTLGLAALDKYKKFDILSYGFFQSSCFLFIRSFSQFFGHPVFYLFGPLDLVKWSSSWSSGFLFIRSSGFGQMVQLIWYLIILKTGLFEGRMSNGLVFKWSGFSYGYSFSPLIRKLDHTKIEPYKNWIFFLRVGGI